MFTQLKLAANELHKSNILASANLKYEARDYYGALAEYTTVILLQSISVTTLEPETALVYAARGVTRYRLGDIAAAMSDYTTAIALDPNLAVAYYRRACLHYFAENYLSAIADYNKAIALNPNDAQAHFNRSRAYRKLYGKCEAVVDLLTSNLFHAASATELSGSALTELAVYLPAPPALIGTQLSSSTLPIVNPAPLVQELLNGESLTDSIERKQQRGTELRRGAVSLARQRT